MSKTILKHRKLKHKSNPIMKHLKQMINHPSALLLSLLASFNPKLGIAVYVLLRFAAMLLFVSDLLSKKH